MTAPVAACPRCGGRLIRNHDETVCLVHGTIHTPVRAWDLPSLALAVGTGRPVNAFRLVPWTERERQTWAEWSPARGPLPSEDGYECGRCWAQFGTAKGLTIHQTRCRGEGAA